MNGCNGTSSTRWRPNDILDITNTSFRYVVLILNRPIQIEPNLMYSLWERALLRLTVDGGTDRWFKWVKCNSAIFSSSPKLPDLVTGDMDSISPCILQRLQAQSETEIIYTPDQDHTDYTKAIMEISNYVKRKNISINGIITIAQTSGRFDQIMANIQTMFLATKLIDVPLYQLTENSITWLLVPGSHVIEVPPGLRKSNIWCSLIPINGRCDNVTTTGLKWNLDNQALQFGQIVSTSNTYSGEAEVTVKNSNHLIWSMGLISD